MRNSLKLNLDHLAVDSFPTSGAEPAPQPDNRGEPLLTCLQTNCGKILCCA
jgi:hypothetical protein